VKAYDNADQEVYSKVVEIGPEVILGSISSETPSNQAPSVDAGSNQTITLPDTASLNGDVSDDGLPNGSLSTTWAVVSGPGNVSFADASSVDTITSFSTDGTYVLRLMADDGDLSDSDEMTVTVNTEPALNQVPSVNAGANQTITLPDTASLDGTASDDGLPDGSLTTTWSVVSGPGSVSFGNTSAMDTTADFSTDGTYVLKLTADDGDLSDSDSVTITVNAETPTPGAGPVISVDNAQGNPGEVVQVPVTIDSATNGVSGSTLEITLSDSSVARIDDVELDSAFVSLNSNQDDTTDTHALFSGIDADDSVQIGAADITLATLHIEGLTEGNTQVQVNVIALDDDEGSAIGADTDDGSISVMNTAPVVTISSDSSTINQGSTFSGSAVINDPGDQTWNIAINYGDGSDSQDMTVNSTSVDLEHVYSASGVFTVTVTATDNDGAEDSEAFMVTINATSPTLPGLTLPSQDIDGDGRYEDLNGNGAVDMDDIVSLFSLLVNY
jgi:hypothetical protein